MGLFKSTGLDQECSKAAQILKSFIDKGKIPSDVVANAKGLAIFSGFRAGMYFAGAGGSGIVIARLPSGSWSLPSAFSVRSGAFGLVYGVDVYDCVCVLNTEAAVDSYATPEMNLGGGVALAAGPLGGTANAKEVKPVWTYTKSRGLYGGVTVDGTVIKEKQGMNTEVYGPNVTAGQILKGQIKARDGESAGRRQLMEILALLEGKKVDAKILQEISAEPTPGDLEQ
ncbi:uncharacterized protein A1O9_09400 [Exophiala aquamarina CBS 119918]|uniref:Ysc84 actin-binding domain-containing protein n=1 Tax=Exophiala aquamarina CBS 119918 TaxID=1182545 RepID=A0A072P286_9EURO|nr:uncharacterized protein A1O9_09400 [Exophiala aquamarina CBS 119918]KEF54234.1 hypothetical protein A1O9_09400 [Exophiala aquamarina CBS 119918]